MTSLLDFQETPYEDESWEIVGEPPSEDVFVPLNLSKVDNKSVKKVDEFFPQYGEGIADQKQFWHLPDITAGKIEEKEEVVGPPKISFTEEELQQKMDEAFQAGVKQGEEVALEKQNSALDEMREHLSVLIKDLSIHIEENLSVIESRAVDLSLKIAQKLMTAAVEFNPEYIVHIMRDALKEAKTATIQLMRVSPQDLEFIQVVGLDKDAEFSSIQIVADETIRAGCVIETSAGHIDANLDEAFERIKEAVVKVAS